MLERENYLPCLSRQMLSQRAGYLLARVPLGLTGQKPRIRVDSVSFSHILWRVSRPCVLLPQPWGTECYLPLRKLQRDSTKGLLNPE